MAYDSKPWWYDSNPWRYDSKPWWYDSMPWQYDSKPWWYDSKPWRYDSKPWQYNSSCCSMLTASAMYEVTLTNIAVYRLLPYVLVNGNRYRKRQSFTVINDKRVSVIRNVEPFFSCILYVSRGSL